MTWSELGEPMPPLRHGSERACHEGDCTRCRQDQERAEREEEVTAWATTTQPAA